jgi:hypothetical protein
MWREGLPAIESKQHAFEPFKEDDSQGAKEAQLQAKGELPAIGKPAVNLAF